MIRQPISFRRIVYGSVRASGVITYVGLSGTNNEYIHMVVTIAAHQVQSIGQMYFDGHLSQYDTGDPTGLIPYPYYDLEVDLGKASRIPLNRFRTWPRRFHPGRAPACSGDARKYTSR